MVAAPPNIDPCMLLTHAEVEHVLGPLKGNPKADKEGQATWCNYEFANGKDAMEVWVFPAKGIARGRKQAKQPVAVKGLGDDAFMDRGMHGLDYVNRFFKKHGYESTIAESPAEDKLKSLGPKAVGRF